MQKASTMLVANEVVLLRRAWEPEAPGRKLVLKREKVFGKSRGH